jgi:signal transduction histidine kinase
MAALQTELAIDPGTTTELNRYYLQKLEREKYYALALTLFLVIFSFTWLLFRFENGPGQNGPALVSNGMAILASLIGAIWTFRATYWANHGPLLLGSRHRLAWTCIGLGLLANAIGHIFTGYTLYILKTTLPTPSYADIGFTLFYALCLAGLLLLPIQEKAERLGPHIVIDSLITVLCLLGISGYIILNPIFLRAQPGRLFSTLVAISYPCWDILLILALVLFIRQRAAPVLRSSLLICGLGVLARVWADSSSTYLSSYGHYQTGIAAVDSFWFLSCLLIGITPLYQYSAIARRFYLETTLAGRNTNKTSSMAGSALPFEGHLVLLRSFIIYVPFTILLTLTLYSQFTPASGLAHFLDILCGTVLLLIITHYLLATYENAQLVHEKEQSRQEAELLRKSTASLTSVLEMDLLLNHIVTVGAADLGFDAAALVLVEEYDRPLDEQSSLLARATTSERTQVMSWRLTGRTIPACLALMGKKIEVRWSEAPAHPPTPVHQWHKELRVQASLFVPLSYQGKIQGSLAFSIRAARHFNEHEYYLANAFAEEAANAIEHARLYELARENALFAQAMSNVAARLNSVVASGLAMGSEIHHLICAEGANALRADLAILYVHHHDGQFIPQAALGDELVPPTFPQEWPVITADETTTPFLHTSQPILIQVNQQFPPNPRATFPGASRPIWSIDLEPTMLPQQSTFPPLPHPAHSLHLSSRPASMGLVPLKNTHPQRSITLQEALQRRYASTAILAPLFIHHQPMGLLVLARTHQPGTREKRSFGLPDLAPAQDFAGQAAIAFTNAQLYQQLRNAHQRMQELDKLKDQFMVTASHELRTPLTAVQGYLELLENYRDALPPEQQQEFLEKASRGCEELVLLLNNVMDASRLEVEAGIRPAHLERVSVREVIENVINLMSLQISQERRDVQVTIPPQLMVKADPARLRQIIRNLSSNALKYSSPGTPLLFSARPVFSKNPAVIISVTDFGKGIKPQDQAKLFQRFIRLESDLNSSVRGSGLGLYISRRLVEAMNGKIWVESSGKPGSGTTFSILLPMP